jgi:hypothetical protein
MNTRKKTVFLLKKNYLPLLRDSKTFLYLCSRRQCKEKIVFELQKLTNFLQLKIKNSMKKLVLFAAIAIAALGFSACQKIRVKI